MSKSREHGVAYLGTGEVWPKDIFPEGTYDPEAFEAAVDQRFSRERVEKPISLTQVASDALTVVYRRKTAPKLAARRARMGNRKRGKV